MKKIERKREREKEKERVCMCVHVCAYARHKFLRKCVVKCSGPCTCSGRDDNHVEWENQVCGWSGHLAMKCPHSRYYFALFETEENKNLEFCFKAYMLHAKFTHSFSSFVDGCFDFAS